MERRRFLKASVSTGAVAVGAGGLGALLDSIPAAASETSFDLETIGVVGSVQSATSEHLVVRTSSGDVEIIPTPGARMYSGASGETTTTRDFLIGDRVAAQGHMQEATLHATSIGSIFEPIEVVVTSVSPDGSIADTTLGPIELKAGRLPYSPASRQPEHCSADIKPRSLLQGLSWQNPASGERYLLVHTIAA